MLGYGVSKTYKDALRDHDVILVKLFEQCTIKGIKLNKSKVVLSKSEVTFLGLKISSKGFMVDPQKVEAIAKMKTPTDLTGAQRLSGLLNYLSIFLPNLSEAMKPIRKLNQKVVDWSWSHIYDNAFGVLKTIITRAPVLQYHNPNKELVIQCDASQSGLGSVLLQDGKPNAYASQALRD